MEASNPLPARGVSLGLPSVGPVAWGTHTCHFYRGAEELREALVPYFRAGLEAHEKCLWVTSEPFGAALARQALAEAVPELDRYERQGQIEILDYSDWYLRSDSRDGEAVLRGWVERAERAQAEGYAGLRLTGNTFWLEREDWESFAAYERAVHESFRTKRILALCSYSLERCNVDDVLDVLRNHEFALVWWLGRWELVRNATQLLAAIHTAAPPPDHLAQIYSEGRFPAGAIAAFLAEGNATSAAAGLVATAEHKSRIEEAIRALGPMPEPYRTLDVDRLLADSRSHGRLDLSGLRKRLEEWLDDLIADAGHARVFGEIVDRLCGSGEVDEAVALEHVWNELLADRPIQLYCAYGLSRLPQDGDPDAYVALSGLHGSIEIDASEEDQRFVARALASEGRRRRELEAERARWLHAERAAAIRLSRLQRATLALSQALTVRDVANALDRDVCPALGASGAVLAVPSGEDGALEIAGASPPNEASAGDVSPGDPYRSVDAELPYAQAFESGTARWLRDASAEHGRREKDVLAAAGALACVPLESAGRRLGVVALGFANRQPFDAGQRALVADVARQIALTLDRACNYEEAKRERERAEAANRAKDEFLAMLGHELRNPLAAIQSATDLLRSDGSEVAPRTTERIHAVLERQSRHIATLVDGLLDLSRITRGKIRLDVETLDLTVVLRETLRDRLALSGRPGVDVRIELPEASLWVDGDRVRLRQIFDNLLANAFQFTDAPGAITLSAGREGEWARISVRDSGAGIDAALLPEIFEPFRQADQSIDRKQGGLGLGLAVVRQLVELHGGSVTASSGGSGLGSEFRIRIPASDPPAGEVSSERASTESASREPFRLLVVEDNEDAGDLMGLLLERAGHRATVVRHGEAALERARQERPDLVLCDIGLPGKLSGYEVARSFRRENGLEETYLVALTGYGRRTDVDRAREAGFDAHMTKPITMPALDWLLANFRDHLGRFLRVRPDRIR